MQADDTPSQSDAKPGGRWRLALGVGAAVAGVFTLAALGLMVVVKDETLARATPFAQGRYGALGGVAYELASVRDTVRELWHARLPLEAANYDRFRDLPAGWSFPSPAASPPPADPGYLLLARADGDLPGAVVELVRLSDLKLLHRWEPDADRLFADPGPDADLSMAARLTRARFRPMHPLLMADGTLILHGDVTPMVALDPCGEALWRTARLSYHHSLNLDGEGMIWSGAMSRAADWPGGALSNGDGTHDTIARLDPRTGAIVWAKPVPEILDENGLTHLVYHAYEKVQDPVHLNDIQPVLADGPFWRAGDLFLSLRTPSLVLLYRPATGKVIWSKAGPWVEQHDVDLLDDHRIMIFNNDVQDRGKGGEIAKTSQPLVYDFRDGSVTAPLAEGAAAARILAVNNGLADRTVTGQTIVEEDTSGRLLIFGADGKLAATFLNRAGDGKAYRMGWSRYIDPELGARALAALDAKACPAAKAAP